MKTLILIAVYLLSFVLIFLMISSVGLVFMDISYMDIIRNSVWSTFYSTFLGWWLAIFPAREFYLTYQEDFSKIF